MCSLTRVTVEVIRDEAGVPTKITLKKGGRRFSIIYDKTTGFKVEGTFNKDFAALLAASSIFGLTAVDISAQTLENLDVDIVAQTIGNLAVDIVAQTLAALNVDITAQSVGNLAMDIAAQSLGNLAIDIAAQSAGDINVNLNAQTADVDVNLNAQTADVDVNLNAQAAAINIDTAGGTNIVIDQLEQDAYTANQQNMTNDGASATGQRASTTGGTLYGKFFPRGCRGHIKRIGLECKDNGAAGGTIAVYIAPVIGMGYTHTAAITVAAGGALTDRYATFDVMWNYDSMFVWWVSSTADMQVSYDTGTPYDAFSSTDAGVTWDQDNERHYVTVSSYGKTVGDLPVSGTINNVPIPSVSSESDSGIVAVPNITWTPLTTVYGAGSLTQVRLVFGSAAAPGAACIYGVQFTVDGNLVATYFNHHITLSLAGTSGNTRIGVFYQTATPQTIIILWVPIEFTRSLLVEAYQSTGGAVNCTGYILTKQIS